ncbi:hypothetical protein C0J52_06746 [Blattella germanica]|nr:hypothetical protein C0J52_06746 [Blattella germanica]
MASGKLWRRRRRQLTRELDEASHQQQATWVASYRDGTEDQETGATAGDPFIQNYGKPWFKIPNTRENNSAFDYGIALRCTVFSSLNGMETRSSPVLSPSSSFPLHPTPCMGLFLPSGSLAAAAAASSTASTTSPPPYEEALKHKVILSSYPTATTVILPTAPPTQMSQMAHAPGFAPTSSSNPTGPN